MTEHVCGWRKWHPWCAQYRCIHPGCHKNMPSDEVERRLNATDRLRAKDARRFANLIDGEYSVGEPVAQELYDYADILEGK